MKLHHVLVAVLLLSVLTNRASAQDSTIILTGKLVPTTCVVKIGNGAAGADGSVQLPAVPAIALPTAGLRGPTVGWSMVVGSDTDHCQAPKVQVGFRNSGNVNTAGRLANTGTAGNVDVVLINQDDGDVDINLATNANSQVRDIPPAVGWTALNYGAAYQATGTATPGTVVTSVQYDLVYP